MKNLIKIFLIFGLIMGCEDPVGSENSGSDIELDSTGILQINFIYKIQGIQPAKVKRADLSLAYTADSMYRGEFFRATNVSDAKSKYRFYLPSGTYYYHATIICLAGGDSCMYTGFGGENGMRMDGGKVVVKPNQLTEVTTQFH